MMNKNGNINQMNKNKEPQQTTNNQNNQLSNKINNKASLDSYISPFG